MSTSLDCDVVHDEGAILCLVRLDFFASNQWVLGQTVDMHHVSIHSLSSHCKAAEGKEGIEVAKLEMGLKRYCMF